MHPTSLEILVPVTARVIAEKNSAIRLGIKVMEQLRKVYPGTELAAIAASLCADMQVTHDLTIESELKKLLKRSEALAESNTVPNSPPAA